MVLLQWFILCTLSLMRTAEARPRTDNRRLQEVNSTNELVFSVTYRDFLPATCPLNVNLISFGAERSALIRAQREAWNTTVNPARPDTCQTYFTLSESDENFQINRQLALGEIAGHPDFEALGQAENFVPCTDGVVAGVDFPVSTCIFLPPDENGIITKDPFLSIVADELAIGSNGLPQLQYCNDDDGGETRCGFVRGTDRQAQTQKKFFDTWFNDDLKFNKRIGQSLVLRADPDEAGLFVFNSTVDADSLLGDNIELNHFGPLDAFTVGDEAFVKLEETDDIIDAPAWPRTIVDDQTAEEDVTVNRSYYFTTELHTTFVFNRSQSMLFSFQGDDDFWAFVNGKMVIDLGGVHESLFAEVDLNGNLSEDMDIASFLDLEDGEVATLDIFHAERQTSQSFFAITTSLSPACNVQLSGSSAVDLVVSSEDLDLFTFSSNAIPTITEDGMSEIILQSQGNPFSVGYFFTTIAENVGRGFEVSFDISIAGITEGFAFVVQNQGVQDYPLSSGSTFGFQGVTKSFAVVFDLCADRDTITSPTQCTAQTVSVHHQDSPDEGNFFGNATRRTFDSIARNLARDEFFPINIIHYGGQPNFLEVYVNGSLYLRENDFDILSILDGTGAHTGLTATSSGVSADIKVRNFVLNTVEVVPSESQFVGNLSEVQAVVADGIDLSEGVQIVTRDFCENQVESGTLGTLFDAKYFEVMDENTNSRRLQEEAIPFIQDAVIIDNNDGSYNIALQTEIATSFALAVAFGEGCEILFSEDDGDLVIEVNDTLDTDACFFNVVNDAEVVAVSTPVPDIDVNETDLPDNEGNDLPVLAVATTGSLCFLCVLLVLVVFLRKRRIWEGVKTYVPTGQLFRTELDTRFDNQNEYNATGMQVLQTQQQILDLQSHTGLTERHKEIVELREENKAMKEIIRASKIKAAAHEAASDNDADSFEDEEEEELPPAPVLAKAGKNEF